MIRNWWYRNRKHRDRYCRYGSTEHFYYLAIWIGRNFLWNPLIVSNRV